MHHNKESQDSMKLTGRLKVWRINPKGALTLERCYPNLVVTSGKVFVASRMVGTATAVMSHMALGANAVPTTPGDMALGAELGIVALTSAVATLKSVEYTATFPAGTGTGLISEAGIFNAASSGAMLCRTTFPAITKAIGDTIAVSWTVTLS